jgi:hypothetical protein
MPPYGSFTNDSLILYSSTVYREDNVVMPKGIHELFQMMTHIMMNNNKDSLHIDFTKGRQIIIVHPCMHSNYPLITIIMLIITLLHSLPTRFSLRWPHSISNQFGQIQIRSNLGHNRNTLTLQY